MPELSVILPARNAETTVAAAVSSTLRALPRDAELVVLDDGSTDATAQEVIRGAGGRTGPDPRLRLLQTPPSGGLTQALSQLIAATDSRTVARMDADDLCMPWRFRISLPHLRRDCDLVFTQVVNLVGRRPDPEPPVGITPEAFPLHLLLTNPVSHPTALIRREVLDRVGGYRRVPAEDYDLWLRCAAGGARLRRIGAWGLVYRIHPDQITASDEWRTASWRDPLQAEAFADLSERLVGRRLPRLVALARVAEPERSEAVEAFRAAVLPAISGLGGFQERFLRYRLDRRCDWVRSSSGHHASQPRGSAT